MDRLNDEFNNMSIKFNKSISKIDRQNNGIFFTPKSGRNKLINVIKSLNINPKNILEPSFGSGEFIDDINIVYTKSIINGVEKHKEMYETLQKKYENNNNVKLFNEDFLLYNTNTKYDLILGNPPYFVVKEKNEECMIGRGNIFVMFIYKCIKEHLNKNGILAFVLPTSLYNCSYYEPCRKYINNNCDIVYLENLKIKYYDTTQNTMLLVLKKCKEDNEDKYIFKTNNLVFITPYYKELNELIKGSSTLKELGFLVKGGDIVWNEHKRNLDNTGTLLIYSNNIVNNKLIIKPEGFGGDNKKQYIKNCNKEKQLGPVIIIPRGYGTSSSFKFSYAYIDNDIGEFYAENHVNIIYPITQEAIKYFDRIKRSFEHINTIKFIEYFDGKSAISKTELQNIFPIFNV
jgi:adenine-specific DNA-methyltransferase